MMVDRITNLKNQSICDLSCGDGQFLVEIVKRLCMKLQNSTTQESYDDYYKTLLGITGFDIDEEALDTCRLRLTNICKKYNINMVDWQLCKIDVLQKVTWENFKTFDYIIGNPPYVRIQHLEKWRRALISSGNWFCVSGCSDLFIVFFKVGLQLLKALGKLMYITPNSWIKNHSCKLLRQHLKNYEIPLIIDFGRFQVFQGVTTYTAITEAVKKRSQDKTTAFNCVDMQDGKPSFKESKLIGDNKGWNIVGQHDEHFMKKIELRSYKLNEISDIHVGIQTLADRVFIFLTGSIDIESEVTKRILKVSVMKNRKDVIKKDVIKHKIIYPYIDGKRIPEMQLASNYPKAYKYLLSHKKKLLARDKGAFDKNKWYGFGRSVSIVSGFGEKVLTSSINSSPNFHICHEPDVLFYSGYWIKPKTNISFNALLSELNSNEMDTYMKIVSKPLRDGWYSYTKSFIKDYPVSEKIYG